MDLISKSLHYIGQNFKDASVIQIGAMDGINFDDTRGFLDMYNWKALLVEPVPALFNELKENFKDRNNYTFEQCAIAEYDGDIQMLTIPPDVIEREDLHPGYKGMSALYPLKNGFGSDYQRDIEVKAKFGVNIKVPALTFESLLKKHNITSFDILICDAEGYDWSIFKQIDLQKYKPKFIRLEYINLSSEEKALTENKLKEAGYVVSVGSDIDAVISEIWDIVEEKTTTLPQEDIDKSLNYYAEKYGTDKAVSKYTDVYDYLFNDLRKQELALLEIGIGSLDINVKGHFRQIREIYYDYYRQGGSLRMWRDYFSKAEIHGLDVAEDCRFSEERISTFICSSLDKDACNNQLQANIYDIIIDDGLHQADAQLQTLRNFFDRVRIGGYYIIEDIGGGGDGSNLFVDKKQELLGIVKEHEYFFGGNYLVIRKNNSRRGQLSSITKFKDNTQEKKSDLTVVTGLWNIGRPGRSFDHYLECFDKLLKVDVNLFLFIPKELEDFVWQRRSNSNTAVKIFELSDVQNLFSPFWDRVQELRTSENWLSQAGWLIESPQASLEWYNPIVMSKMSLLHDASIYNPFDTENFAWIDAGITNTINYNLLINTNFFELLPNYFDPFLFVTYPYPYFDKGVNEIHGFNWKALNQYADSKVDWICRGGLFGGKREALREVNSHYWHILNRSLQEGHMGTEESVFSILAGKYPELCRTSRVTILGLIQHFVEKVLDGTAELEPIVERPKKFNKYVDTSKLKVSIYMLTFNFPHQVEHTIQTWLKHPKWITDTRNILIDNSTNEEARIANAEICKKYNFEHIITNENTGINGGRFRAAQHFQESDSDYYLFLEDDMGIHEPVDGFCRNGFRTYVPNLYDKVLKILHGSDVDFLKLSYTEVYMDNNIQVSWYNVPQSIRTRDWPDYDTLPTEGLDPNCPKTKFDTIEVIDGVSYITGDIYYANWPTICGKKGNQKMFLTTTWARPYEQTWMSYMYQETKEGRLRPAVLLASPIHHNRIAHYKPEERREN